MKNLRILSGVHSSGKSTVGRLLSENFRFIPEVAPKYLETSRHRLMPWEIDARTDAQIIDEEIGRDDILSTLAEIAFVESWHVGNIAHTRVRNPNVADQKWSAVVASRSRFDTVRVYFLDCPPDVVRQRTTYFTHDEVDAAIRFYDRLRIEIETVCFMLGVDLVRLDAVKPPNESVSAIMAAERKS